MRFATFNIRFGRALDGGNSWPLRRRATASAIVALGADVIGLQEVQQFQRSYLARAVPGSRWFGQGRSGGRDGEQCPVVVTNVAITVLEEHTRWFGPDPDTPGVRLPGASFPRIATIVRCREEGTRAEFTVVNTHLDEHLNENRATSARQLVEWVDGGVPTVVLGDFNAGPNNTAVVGPLTEAGFQLAAVTGGTSHNFTGTADGHRIDHIFLSPHWTIEDAAVVRERPYGRLPSDHWPVRVTARLSSE